MKFLQKAPLSSTFLLVIASSSQQKQAWAQEECAASGCESGELEYRFNPIATSWDAHRVLAQQMGCELASITSPEEQAAAVAAMEPYLGYPYYAFDGFGSAFAYIGGRVVSELSSPRPGQYVFQWVDGSGLFEVERSVNTEVPFTNFVNGDPNGGTYNFLFEPYMALSLDENGSSGIPRGSWIDFPCANSPALYKCCKPLPPPTSCSDGGKEYFFSTLETTWEAHKLNAESLGCTLASIQSPEEQAAAEAAMQPYIGYPYDERDNFANSFAYVGARMVMELSNSETGEYVFEWTDGSGQFQVSRGTNTEAPYSNFIPNDPNSGTAIYGNEPYLALSLEENSSFDIPRGKWVDFSSQNSPALYQCCPSQPVGDYSTCEVAPAAPTPQPTPFTRAPVAPVSSTPIPTAAPVSPAPTDSPSTAPTFSPLAPTPIIYVQSDTDCNSMFQRLQDDPDAITMNIDSPETPVDTIDLQRPFLFKGTDPITTLVVTSHGSINLDGSLEAVSGPVPISRYGTGYEAVARIQVAQSSIRMTTGTTIGGRISAVRFKDLGDSTLISWEAANIASRAFVDFQARLYDDGTIEMTWAGTGFDSFIDALLPVYVGIEDGMDLAVPGLGLMGTTNNLPDLMDGLAQGRGGIFAEDSCVTFSLV